MAILDPLNDQPGAPGRSATAAKPAPIVLSVDDEEANRYIRAHTLQSAGFEVVEAATGGDALRLAAEEPPALIVLDVRLPDLDGFEVCRRLRADPRTATIPVLHVSATGALERDLPEALENESDAYLSEPIDPQTLIATARALIRTREYRDRLRKIEARNRAILEQAFEGIWVVDAAGRTDFVNRRMAEMLLCSGPEELAGTNLLDFVPDEDRDSVRRRFDARISSDGRERYELRLRRKDGSAIWVSVAGSNLFDEQRRAAGRIALFTDITERKRFEASLLESRQRQSLAIDAAELGTWEVDLSTRAVTSSDRTRAMGDIEEAEPLLETWLAGVHPDDRARLTTDLQTAIAAPGRFDAEFRVSRRDGSIGWIAAKAVPVLDENGRAVRLVGVSQDVTSRKRADEARERQRELLQGIIDHIPVMLCLYDPSLQRFELNSEAQRVLGWTNADANDGDFMAKVYPDPAVRADAVEYMQSLSPGWREIEVTAKDGSKVASEWANIRLSDERMIGIGIDVRTRKADEERLRESEERYRGLFEAMREGFHLSEVIFDEAGKAVDWRFLAVNPAFEAMTGVSRDRAVGRLYSEVFQRPDRAYWAAFFGEVAITGDSRQFDDVDVGRHWQAAVYSPRPGQFAVMFNDVTERKRAEAAAARREHEYETLAENAPEVIARFDRDLRHIYINNYGATVYGKAIDEILGKTNAELGFPEENVAIWRRQFEDVFSTGQQRIVGFEFDSPNLGHQYFSSVFVPETDGTGNVVSILAITRDVTEERRAAAAREELVRELSEAAAVAHRNRSELEAVLQAMQDGVCVFDMRGIVVFVNDAEAKVAGYGSKYEMLRDVEHFSKTFELRRLDGSPLPLAEWPVSRVLRGESIHDVELRGRRSDTGQEWHYSFSGEPVYAPDGPQLLAVLITRDITDRVRAEERVRQAQKLESVGLLAGGIAHDFNNLLTGIMGNASMALDEVGASAAERIHDVISSAERAASLTRQLLAYSGKGQFVLRDVDISEAVHEIASLVEFSIPKSVQLAVSEQRRLPAVRMDPSQFQQILMNLVINAGEAIGEGNPGQITISTSMTDVDPRFVDAAGQEVSPGRYVCVEVSDTGSGIDEKTRSRIFDPFFTTKFTGRGLGLAAVAGIVRAQHGAITVESAPGSGSTFRILLPASSPQPEEQAPGTAESGRGTVLVVDDEPTVRNFIAAVLRKQGYRVLTAADGREALAIHERESGAIDAAVLDVIMPLMGANDTLPKLKGNQPGLKVLLTSGYSESEARRLCATYPGATFIQKPYTAQQLSKALEELLAAE